MRLNSIATAIVAGALTAHAHGHGHGHGHGHNEPDSFDESKLAELQAKWGTDWSFSGISTFAHLPHTKCLTDPSIEFDIGIIGAPFDTAVSYRPGARFGPRAIRSSSARQISFRSFNARAGINPYTSWARVVDCGDIPVSPFDNALALHQLSEAYIELGSRKAATEESGASYKGKSRLVTLGGDHSVALPALRALKERYGEAITVLHFDAHLDTWHPGKYPSAWVDASEEFSQSFFNHGSVFWLAGTEGLIANGSVHAGLRTRLSGNDFTDYEDDSQQGWYRIPADEIDDLGVKTVIERIVNHIGTERPVYLSVDIDVIDPGLAPATGTPEPGGWTTREMIRILRGVEELNLVGADIVEVSPAYDDAGESTSLAAAQVAFEIITSMVKRGVKDAKKAKAGAEANKDEL